MKRLRVAVILVVAIVFVFLVPIVPSNLNLCPPNALCPIDLARIPTHVSISYYAVGVGGRLIGNTYQVLFWPGWICHPSRTQQGGYDCYQIISSPA